MTESQPATKDVSNVLSQASVEGVNTSYDIGTVNATGPVEMPTTNVARPFKTSPLQGSVYANFFKREVLIKTYSFTSASLPFLAPETFAIREWFLNTAVQEKLKNFRYWRGGFKVRYVINVPAGAYGMLMLAPIPYGRYPSSSARTISDSPAPFQIAQADHVLIPFSQSSDAIVDLPYFFPCEYAMIDNSDFSHNSWTVAHSLLSVPGSGVDNAVTVNVQVFCQAVDFDIFIPEYQMLSQAAGIAKNITTAVAPLIPELAIPAAAAMGAAQKTLEFFGYTRETNEETPTTMVKRPFSNVANVDVPDTSEIAALSVNNATTTDPTVGGGLDFDEGSFRYLYAKWTLMHAHYWASTDAPGTDIALIVPVTPFWWNQTGSFAGAMPVCGYIGMPFTYWRGDMEFKIVIPASKFHRGTLQVYWTPNGIPVPPGTDPTNLVYNQILHINADTTYTFCVGYASNKPMLKNTLINNSGDAVETNGFIHFRVVNAIQSQEPATIVNLLIFVRGKDNIEFAVPRNWIDYPWPGDGIRHDDFGSAVILQMGEEGALGDDLGKDVCVDLVPPSGEYPVKEIHAGERFGSVRALVQKFSQVELPRYTGSFDYTAMSFVHFGNLISQWQYESRNPSSAIDIRTFDWMSYYQCMFAGVAGSVRYKMLSTTATPLAIGFAPEMEDDSAGTISWNTPTLAPTWCTQKAGDAVETLVPYYSRYQFEPAYWFLPINVSPMGPSIPNYNISQRKDIAWITPLQPPATLAFDFSQASFAMYRAAGPDIRFLRFRFCPHVTFDTQGPGIPFGNYAWQVANNGT